MEPRTIGVRKNKKLNVKRLEKLDKLNKLIFGSKGIKEVEKVGQFWDETELKKRYFTLEIR